MARDKGLEVLLQVDYSKLLAYLAGDLVSIFSLFQIAAEIAKFNWLLLFLASSFSSFGVFIFTYAGYHNWKEIVDLENKLGLSKNSKPSGIFSKRKNDGEREVSIWLKIGCWVFVAPSLLIWLYCIDFVIFKGEILGYLHSLTGV
jgi:hypothetical protein